MYRSCLCSPDGTPFPRTELAERSVVLQSLLALLPVLAMLAIEDAAANAGATLLPLLAIRWGYKPEKLENEVMVVDSSHWWRAQALWEGERVLVLAYEHMGAECATDEMKESLGVLEFPAGKPVPRHRSCGYCGRPGWPNVWCPWPTCLATFCSASCRYYHCRDIHARNPRAGVSSVVAEPPGSTREDPEAVRKGAHTSYKMRGRKLKQEEMFPQLKEEIDKANRDRLSGQRFTAK